MSSSLQPTPASLTSRAAWGAARLMALAATVILITALVVRPEVAQRVLWNVLIPLLPASFLITPALWRGICPLATLNMAELPGVRCGCSTRPRALTHSLCAVTRHSCNKAQCSRMQPASAPRERAVVNLVVQDGWACDMFGTEAASFLRPPLPLSAVEPLT